MEAPRPFVQAISSSPPTTQALASLRHTPFRFGRYQLIHPLGRGGMAEVWMARAHALGDAGGNLALKRMLPELCNLQRLRERFLAEAKLALRLRHRNLLRALDAGEVDGQQYIAMELIDGIDLRELLRARRRWLPVPCCAFIALEVCNALAYAHALTDERGTALKLVHRDVSLSNVMVERAGSVKLLDFGVAKRVGAKTTTDTLPGTFVGKPGYFAPEQLAGGEYDHRADIFAVGVVLHEMLTGRRLFKGPDEETTIKLNQTCEVLGPSRLNPQVSPRLDQITLRALARDPETRYGSAAELAADLTRVLEQYNWRQLETAGLVRLHLSTREPSLPTVARPTNDGSSVERTRRKERRDTIRDSRPWWTRDPD
jgi:serine/threonine-protein kinase